jgi:hypothetical protein
MPPVGFEPKISAGERPVAARLPREKKTGKMYSEIVSLIG